LIEEGKALQSIQVLKRFLTNGEEIPFLEDNTVDMGSSFDLFHEVSHHDSTLVSGECNEKRNFLRKVMIYYGFKPYYAEWWHYTLENEPFPDTYFDFVVE
jgi:D-alanyl-D-alanine dipeptidase